MSESWELMVFYDGACLVCSSEMARYRKLDRQGKLLFIDISASEFDPARFGRAREEFMAQVHVRDRQGNYHVGAEAFPLIWRVLPQRRYHMLARCFDAFTIRAAARWGYRFFARNRHRFPRRPQF